MNELGRWLREMDAALLGADDRIDTLVERGLVLLDDELAADDVDRLAFQRVINRLRDATDLIAAELSEVRRERRELARTRRAHAGYRAAAVAP